MIVLHFETAVQRRRKSALIDHEIESNEQQARACDAIGNTREATWHRIKVKQLQVQREAVE